MLAAGFCHAFSVKCRAKISRTHKHLMSSVFGVFIEETSRGQSCVKGFHISV